jgi:putative peptide zinc metalloprotease protein
VRERRLTVRADSDGCFFDPKEQFSTPTSVEPDELPNWDGYPLDAKNCGAVLPAGTVIGRISPPGAMVARMAVSEADLGEVRIGQRVRLISEQSPSRLLFGTVTDISPRVVDPDEVRLMLLWQLPFIFGADGRAMLEQPYHEVVARIEGRHDELRTFVPGIAGIEVRAESLSARMLRFCQQTFRPVY